MDQLDYTKLYKAYSRRGESVVTPRCLKILVYGCMNNLYTSRAIEQACRRDINFMWLLEGAGAPTIIPICSISKAANRRGGRRIILPTGRERLEERKEIDRPLCGRDKMRANANKYSFVWRIGQKQAGERKRSWSS